MAIGSNNVVGPEILNATSGNILIYEANVDGNADVLIEGTNLTITPISNFNGEISVFIQVTDEGGLSDTQTFVLTVNPINDRPAFTLDRDNVNIDEDFSHIELVKVTDYNPPFEEEEQVVKYSLEPPSVEFADILVLLLVTILDCCCGCRSYW